MVCFYAELGVTNYKIVTRFRPSIVAEAAWYATCATLHKRYICHETFKMQTRLHEKLVIQCAKIMMESHSLLKSNNRRTEIYHKYSSKTRGAVALYPPAKSLLPCHRWRI
ncbi:Cyclin A/B/D/E [Artemisia annua]|uniref:Cyclin A/B/D/E n=1 Tax=Artemisia annua TaxID=35608 RepID=A0A2U1MBX2_ARTAN|nr:Cyclin A/B/D/E [Artemisia annua]